MCKGNMNRSKTFIEYKFGMRDKTTNAWIGNGDVYRASGGRAQTDEEAISWLKDRERYMPHQKIVEVQCYSTEVRDLNYEDIK
jgi:hypothetical protein